VVWAFFDVSPFAGRFAGGLALVMLAVLHERGGEE
jgi:hypothetical protein